ncbi:MAG: hypothetical protein N0E54_06265 [Candidatus Thiodiazotropha taylori]|nr:hypothetical protein [Candidatus Thiodiazotropha endolucinida]MCW4228324.1 hypothetical protein [Candidatus Thiodiazotropha taylori]
MKTNILMSFFLLMTSILTGCSTSLMKESKSNIIKTPAKNLASIVFMRNSLTSNIFNMEVFEIINGELKIIGALPNGSKFVHQTEPGRKVFMTYGHRVDFMIADVLPGKTYYSIVRPIYASGIFVPTPIRKVGGKYNMSSPQFKDWVDNTQLHTFNKAAAQKWFDEHKEKINKEYKNTWVRFEKKSSDDLANRTLNPQDGV